MSQHERQMAEISLRTAAAALSIAAHAVKLEGTGKSAEQYMDEAIDSIARAKSLMHK